VKYPQAASKSSLPPSLFFQRREENF